MWKKHSSIFVCNFASSLKHIPFLVRLVHFLSKVGNIYFIFSTITFLSFYRILISDCDNQLSDNYKTRRSKLTKKEFLLPTIYYSLYLWEQDEEEIFWLTFAYDGYYIVAGGLKLLSDPHTDWLTDLKCPGQPANSPSILPVRACIFQWDLDPSFHPLSMCQVLVRTCKSGI